MVFSGIVISDFVVSNVVVSGIVVAGNVVSGVVVTSGDSVAVSRILRTFRPPGLHLEHWMRKEPRPKMRKAEQASALIDLRFDSDLNTAVGEGDLEDDFVAHVLWCTRKGLFSGGSWSEKKAREIYEEYIIQKAGKSVCMRYYVFVKLKSRWAYRKA